MGGLFGKSKSKTKVERKIPKPTLEEEQMLQRLMELTEEPYQTMPELQEALRQPFQSLNSPFGQALMEIIIGGYNDPSGMYWMRRFASNPANWGIQVEQKQGQGLGQRRRQGGGMRRGQNFWNNLLAYASAGGIQE